MGTHHHEHSHSHEVDPALIKRDRRRLFGITVLQACMTATSAGVSVFTGSAAFNSEMAHDMGDTAINGIRAVSTYSKSEQSGWYTRFRFSSYSLISGFGIYTMLNAATDLLHVDTTPEFSNKKVAEIVGAGFIAGGNTWSYRISRRLEGDTYTNSDSVRHNRLDKIVSLATAAAIVIGTVVPYVTELTGVAVGFYSVTHMLPTKHNLGIDT